MTDFAFIKRCMLCGENNIKQSISCSGCNNILDREIELEEIPIEYVECVCGEKIRPIKNEVNKCGNCGRVI